MNRLKLILSLAVLGAGTAAAPGPGGSPAASGNLPQQRDGSIWNGYDHQIDRAEARTTEKRRGVYPPRALRAQQRAAERLLSKRLHREAAAPPGASEPPH